MSASPDDDIAQRLASVVESSDDAILSLDADGVIDSWNPAAEEMFGYTPAEALGHSVAIIIPPHCEQEHAEIRRRVLAGQPLRGFETERRRRDGTIVPVVLNVSPIRDASGAVTGATAVLRDSSHRDRGERAARRLAAIIESSDDAIISKDLNGIVTSWNAAAERVFGYAAAEMIGQSIRRIIPPDRQSEEDEVLGRIRRGDRIEHFETIRRRKDGTYLPISLTVSPILDGAGRVVGASKIARDISDRKAAEAERASLLNLAQRQAEVTRTLNHVGTVVASSLDREAIVQSVTDAARQATGAEFGAFFYNVTDPRSGEVSMVYTLSGASKEAFASFPHPRATSLFGPTFRGEATVRIDDVTRDPRYGQSPPYYGMPPGHLPVRSYLALPVTARSGEVLGGLFFGHSSPGVFTAEHEQVAAGIAAWASVALENARLYVLAQEASRLKDEFLATLSHELRTPLNAIIGYARMVRDGVVKGEKHDRAVETIERNAGALAGIVNDVLDVSRIVSGKIELNPERADLIVLVRDAIDAVVPSASTKNITIDAAFDRDAVFVWADTGRLQQVLWNIMSNAVKFTPPGGRIDVSTSVAGDQVEVRVTDTGIGISADFLPRIFERFSQGDNGPTRERGGLGLGLAIARHLVQLHGGRIEAFSAGVGQGTTMTIALPLETTPERAVVQGHAARHDRHA